jgi:hypothetical protein
MKKDLQNEEGVRNLMRIAPVQELLKKRQRNQKNLDKYKRTSQTPTPRGDA